MERQALEQKVIECAGITYKRDIGELSMETTVKELGGKSILMVAFVSLLENELGVLVPLPTASKCTTLKEFTDVIEALF